jgi:hypothetical protein
MEVQLLKGTLQGVGHWGKSSCHVEVQSDVLGMDFAAKLQGKKVPGVALRFQVRGPIEGRKKRNWGRLLTGQRKTKTRWDVGHRE